MEIKERYIKKYWYQIIRDQISDELEAQGYHVWVKKKFESGIYADIYAEKDNDKQIIEISSKKIPKEQFIRLHQYAVDQGIKFKAVIANLNSLKTEIDWDEFESALCTYMNNNGCCDKLGYSAKIEDITDVDFNLIQIDGNKIFAKGQAICEVEIQMDSEGDIDFAMHFPMTFAVTFNSNNGKWEISGNDVKIEVDTCAFYE